MFKWNKTEKKFHVNVLSKNRFNRAASQGIASLFDVETDIGGFRLMHAYTQTGEASYVITFFKNFRNEPLYFSLELEDFHMLVTYWILANQIFQNAPEEYNHPYENLKYCLVQMVKEQPSSTHLH